MPQGYTPGFVTYRGNISFLDPLKIPLNYLSLISGIMKKSVILPGVLSKRITLIFETEISL